MAPDSTDSIHAAGYYVSDAASNDIDYGFRVGNADNDGVCIDTITSGGQGIYIGNVPYGNGITVNSTSNTRPLFYMVGRIGFEPMTND